LKLEGPEILLQVHKRSDILRKQNTEKMQLERELQGEEAKQIEKVIDEQERKAADKRKKLADSLADKLQGMRIYKL
jgi:hypothetical protein